MGPGFRETAQKSVLSLQWRHISAMASQITGNSTTCPVMRKAFPCHGVFSSVLGNLMLQPAWFHLTVQILIKQAYQFNFV